MSRGHFVRAHVPIHVHRCSDVRMTHQLLLNCNRSAHCVQPTPVRVPHCVSVMLRTPNECYYKCKWEHTDYLQKAMLFTQLVIAVEYQLFFSKDRKASTPPAVPAEDTKSASPPANSGNNQDKKGDKESKAKQDAEKARDSKKADEQISGSAKRSKSYHSEYGDKTLGELKELAKGGDRKAAQMKKLIENAERLSQKRPK